MSFEKIQLPKPKIQTVRINDVKVDNTINIRFQSGQTVHGMAIQQGTYDLETMAMDIREANGIQKPLVLSKRADGELYVLQGNRRTLGGQIVYNDPETPKELKDALNKVQAFVYEGLTHEQEHIVVNDQDAKPFMRSELIQLIWRLQDEGWDYGRLVGAYYRQLAVFTGNVNKPSEVEKLATDKERIAEIKSWLRTTVDNQMLLANMLGERVRRIYLSWFLLKDGLINEKDMGTDVFKIKPERLKALKKLRDAETDTWHPITGSPEFNAKIDEYVKADAEDGDDTTTLKRPSITTLHERMANSQSKAAKLALRYAKGEDVPTQKAEDAAAYRNEQVIEMLQANCNNVKDPMFGELLRALAFGKDLPEIEAMIKTFC